MAEGEGEPGLKLEDLAIGTSAEIRRRVREEDLRAFAAVSGDVNPLHLDDAFARTTPFKGRVAHGMLLGAYISAVLGTRLPGPGAVYVSQTLRFKRPVRIGDEVVTRATVTALDSTTKHVSLSTICSVNGKAVADGEATLRVERRADAPAVAGNG
jgi:3-hydroxybutyryl-CoA dehydratase